MSDFRVELGDNYGSLEAELNNAVPDMQRRRLLQGTAAGVAGTLFAVGGERAYQIRREASIARSEGIHDASLAAQEAIRLANRYNLYLGGLRSKSSESMGKEIPALMFRGSVVFLNDMGQPMYAVVNPLLTGRGTQPLDPLNPNSFWILHQEEQLDGTVGYSSMWLGDQEVAVMADRNRARDWQQICLGVCEPPADNLWGAIGVIQPGQHVATAPPSPGVIRYFHLAQPTNQKVLQ